MKEKNWECRQKKKKKNSSLDLACRNNNIQRRCSLDLVSPNNDTNRVDANKRKVCYKKKTHPHLTPSEQQLYKSIYFWTEYVKKQNYITKKKKFLCLTWSVRTIICMQIRTRNSEETFFSWPIQRRHEAEEEIFSHTKSLLTWLGPSKQPTDAGDSDPREHQPTNSQSWAKRPRFSLQLSLKIDSQISNLWRKCLRFSL